MINILHILTIILFQNNRNTEGGILFFQRQQKPNYQIIQIDKIKQQMFAKVEEYRPSLIETKQQSFRNEIRHRHIEKIGAEWRRKNIYFRNNENYELLKEINLKKLISSFKEGPTEDNIHGMFLYASSSQSDHLFCQFDDFIVDKVINLINQNEMGTNECKALWIMTNYTAYANQISDSYMKKIKFFLRQRPSKEIRKNVILSLTNMIDDEQSSQLFTQSDEFKYVSILFKDAVDDYMRDWRVYGETLQFFALLFRNIWRYNSYNVFQLKFQHEILSLYTQLFQMSSVTVSLRNSLLQGLIQFFGSNLDNSPQLLLHFRDKIESFGDSVGIFMSGAKSSAENDGILGKYLELLTIIYGVFLPENGIHHFINFYFDFFQSHVYRVLEQLLKLKKDFLTTQCLKLLNMILREAELAEHIFQMKYSLITILFYNCEISNYTLNKYALSGLSALITSILYGSKPNLIRELFDILYADGFIQKLLAQSLWKYQDPDLNQQLLQAINTLLEEEQQSFSETKITERPFASLFISYEGLKRLKKIACSSNRKLNSFANQILDKFYQQ